MKTNFLFLTSFLALSLFVKCTSKMEHLGLIIVDDQVNIDSNDIALIDLSEDSLDIEVSKSGEKFEIIIPQLRSAYYTLVVGEMQFNLYLNPRHDLLITLGSDSLAFSGKGAPPNNYLQRKNSSEFDWYANYYKTKQSGEKIVYFRDEYINKLKQELVLLDSNPEFVNTEQKELEYKYYNQLLLDEIILETNPDTDESIMQDLEKLLEENMEDPLALNSSKNYISFFARKLLVKNSLNKLEEFYSKIDHPRLKTHFLESLVSGIHKELQFAEDDFNRSKTIESFINKHQASDSIGHHIFNIIHKFQDAEGRLGSFEYEDSNRDIVSLENFRGKYVYVDFWATWCVNCIKEFPYLKELENQFADKEIAFLGISVDKLAAKEKGKKMVEQKELENVQLLAPFQGFPDRDVVDDEFLKLLYVNAFYLGIPHYALIDPDGKIVDAYFYRPSNPKTEKYLSNLL